MAGGVAGKVGCGCLCVVVGIPLVLCLIKSTNDEFQVLMSKQNARAESRREKARKEASAREAAQRTAEEQARAVAEKERTDAARKAALEAEKKETLEREDRLRTFVLREAPEMWKTYQTLGAQIEVQGTRINELRKALSTFDKDPESDSDYKAIVLMRDEMIETRASLRRKIEDAYFAFRKFEATPNRKDYDALRRKTVEDGIQEAMSATRRFNVMRKEKP